MKLWYWQQQYFIKVEMKEVFLFKPQHIKILFQISWALDHFRNLANSVSWLLNQELLLTCCCFRGRIHLKVKSWGVKHPELWDLFLISFVMSDETQSRSQNFKPLWPPLLKATLALFLGCVVLWIKHKNVESLFYPQGSWLEQWAGIWGRWVSSPSVVGTGRVMFDTGR